MRQRIMHAIRLRLEMNKPFVSSWAQALSLQARHCRWLSISRPCLTCRNAL